MIFNFIEKLTKQLSLPLPGREAQFKMASNMRFQPLFFKHDSEPKNGSVLVLLFPKGDEIYIAFIKRTANGGAHSGQVAFAGGKHEPNDTSRIYTALREAEEEIGINKNDVKILGSLTELLIPVSNINVLPVVGFIDYEPEFILSKNEVEYMITISLHELMKPENFGTKLIQIKEHSIDAPYYNANNEHIWGATAMMLSELIEVVNNIPAH